MTFIQSYAIPVSNAILMVLNIYYSLTTAFFSSSMKLSCLSALFLPPLMYFFLSVRSEYECERKNIQIKYSELRSKFESYFKENFDDCNNHPCITLISCVFRLLQDSPLLLSKWIQAETQIAIIVVKIINRAALVSMLNWLYLEFLFNKNFLSNSLHFQRYSSQQFPCERSFLIKYKNAFIRSVIEDAPKLTLYLVNDLLTTEWNPIQALNTILGALDCGWALYKTQNPNILTNWKIVLFNTFIQRKKQTPGRVGIFYFIAFGVSYHLFSLARPCSD